MTSQHDIYDPPPSRTSWLPPQAEVLTFTGGDLACLAVLGLIVVAGSVAGFLYEPLLGALTMVGGALVVLESWYTALGYLARRPAESRLGRVVIIAAALVPWVVGLGMAAALMIGLFVLTDLGA